MTLSGRHPLFTDREDTTVSDPRDADETRLVYVKDLPAATALPPPTWQDIVDLYKALTPAGVYPLGWRSPPRPDLMVRVRLRPHETQD